MNPDNAPTLHPSKDSRGDFFVGDNLRDLILERRQSIGKMLAGQLRASAQLTRGVQAGREAEFI